ncbi:hypothetical protein NM688_g3781 [Phlebia brevispora]|uniref:Uncharacterized protein n=1 Tax=Phlebia brevispora TaxID=194682 RepID=A0ACC1T4W1_9APHY|nr:hypothetical protein NM688_g3781 [Phlebia brevispora]
MLTGHGAYCSVNVRVCHILQGVLVLQPYVSVEGRAVVETDFLIQTIIMGKIVIEDGAAGFILPYADIVAWGFKDSDEPVPRLGDARSTRAIASMDKKLKTLNRRLSLSASRYRWSMDSEQFEPSQLIILQWRREVGQVLQPGKVEEAVSKFLESIGYEGRKEWIVTGECERFKCWGC